MNRNRLLATAPLAAAALVVAACGGSHPPTLAAAPAAVRAPLAVAERLTVPTEIELAGAVEAERSASVSSRVMASVTAVHARLGERVAAGQILVSIDPAAAQGQLAQAQGAQVQAEAALALAAKNHARFQELAKSDSASELELDLARMQHEQAQGAVEQAKGAVAAARSVAAESKVVAPFAGRVAARGVEAGDLAAPGRPLMTRRLAVRTFLVFGLTEAALGLGAYAAFYLESGWRPFEGLDSDLVRQASTLTFLGIVGGQVGCLFAQRDGSLRQRLSFRSNGLLAAGLLSEFVLAPALVYVPGLNATFSMAPVHPAWLLAVPAAAAVFLALDLVRRGIEGRGGSEL